jgi:hypothetical protein
MAQTRQRVREVVSTVDVMSLVVTALDPSTPRTLDRELVDAEGGAPLRCCLRDSLPGERIALVSVTPPGPRGAYAESGPVFVHAGPCCGPAASGYPDAFRSRTQVFRAYDAGGSIVGGRVVAAGDGQELAAEALLGEEGVAFLQSRNVVHGCFMFSMSRG